MSFASTIYRAHVPGLSLNGLDREPVAIRICARLRWRAHSDITKRTNPASPPSSDDLPLVRGKLRTAIERVNSQAALAVRSFISRGQRLICKIGRPQNLTAGKCFAFLRALVQDANQSTSRIFQAFSFTPVPILSLATVHALNLAEDRKHEVPKKSGF